MDSHSQTELLNLKIQSEYIETCSITILEERTTFFQATFLWRPLTARRLSAGPRHEHLSTCSLHCQSTLAMILQSLIRHGTFQLRRLHL